MTEFAFTALGTSWSVVVDDADVSAGVEQAIKDWLKDFEARFSRFISTSEVNQFKDSNAGTYSISVELAEILARASELRNLTNGAFDPAVASLLEQAGYDQNYSLKPAGKLTDIALQSWKLEGIKLTISGPITFDVGGIGKGYAIDKVADVISKHGFKHYIVDAGGDIFGTTKRDGTPWRVAVAYPGKPDTAAGLVELNNTALAVSDTFKRRWNNMHHIISATEKTPVQQIIGAAAIAPLAFSADSMTSAIFLGNNSVHIQASKKLSSEYLCFQEDGTVKKSTNWPGELFVSTI